MAIVNGKSGTFNIYTNNTPISGYVKWQETYDNATYAQTNKTTVTLTAYLHRTNIYTGPTYFKGASVTRTAYFGSETVTNTSIQDMSLEGSSSNGTPTSGGGPFAQVYTASREITHDSDGNKSITLGFAMSNNVSGVAGNSFTVPKTTATVSLTTVPRATTPTLTSTTITMGSSITVSMNPASSSFKHKLRYSFGTVSGDANGFSIGWDFTAQGNSSATFTPPTSLGSQIPSAMSGTGTLYCYTYAADGTHIGTKTVGITLNVPSYTPQISGITLSGNNLLNGAYVQGKSTVTGNASVNTYYGATIKSISSVIDGKTYTSLPFTTSALSSGSKSVKITFTDSRNKSVTATSSAITVYAYSVPNISVFKLERQSNGTSVVATVQGTIASVNSKNAKTIKVTLNGVTNTITSSSYTINGTTTFTGVPTDTTLPATASFADSYTTITKSATLPTVAVTMDFHHSGKGIAMGKVSEKSDLLDVAWEIKTGKPADTLQGLSYRGDNVISTSEDDSVSNWSYQGNLATTFYTDASTLASKPSTYGFLLNITTGRGNLEAHQLWLEQANGNLHHRGGNLNGFNRWRKVLDDVNCVDYVVEQGIKDDWNYTKWKNGKSEAWRKIELGTLALTTSMAGGVWSQDQYSSRGATLPSGVFTTIPLAFANIYSNGYTNCQVSSANTTQVVYRIWSPYNSTVTNCIVSLYVVGKWK